MAKPWVVIPRGTAQRPVVAGLLRRLGGLDLAGGIAVLVALADGVQPLAQQVAGLVGGIAGAGQAVAGLLGAAAQDDAQAHLAPAGRAGVAQHPGCGRAAHPQQQPAAVRVVAFASRLDTPHRQQVQGSGGPLLRHSRFPFRFQPPTSPPATAD